jgi:hypothetical protein
MGNLDSGDEVTGRTVMQELFGAVMMGSISCLPVTFFPTLMSSWAIPFSALVRHKDKMRDDTSGFCIGQMVPVPGDG